MRRCIGYVCVVVWISFFWGCGRPPASSSENASGSSPQGLPFERERRSPGNSPVLSSVPRKLAEGTPIAVRLQSPLSSASAHAGDTFTAMLDDPVISDGQTLVEIGAVANGRVLEARAAGRSAEPGYLRFVLVSLDVGGKRVMIYTSSIFAKGGSREAAGAEERDKDADKDVVIGTERRLNFRLAQTVEWQ